MTTPTIRRRVALHPQTVPGGGNQYDNAVHKAEVAINRIVASSSSSVTNITNPISGIATLNGITGALTLTSTNNCVLSVVSSTINIDGRVGPRFGYRWPTAGQNITIVDGDYSIYGTSGQHCGTVTFPLAASFPGKIVRFTFPPGGALIPSGADTIDGYSGQTAEYQSDGVSAWKRTWSV